MSKHQLLTVSLYIHKVQNFIAYNMLEVGLGFSYKVKHNHSQKLCVIIVREKNTHPAIETSTPKTLTWENAVEKSVTLQLVRREERDDRDMWYYLLLHRAGDAYHEEFQSQYRRDPSLPLSDWCYILESGEGHDPPQN